MPNQAGPVVVAVSLATMDKAFTPVEPRAAMALPMCVVAVQVSLQADQRRRADKHPRPFGHVREVLALAHLQEVHWSIAPTAGRAVDLVSSRTRSTSLLHDIRHGRGTSRRYGRRTWNLSTVLTSAVRTSRGPSGSRAAQAHDHGGIQEVATDSPGFGVIVPCWCGELFQGMPAIGS